MLPQDEPRRENEEYGEPVLSKAVKAGRRTYFFDVRATRHDEYFLTITESRKIINAKGDCTYDRHKIFLYKEDFAKFAEGFAEALNFIQHSQTEVPAKPVEQV